MHKEAKSIETEVFLTPDDTNSRRWSSQQFKALDDNYVSSPHFPELSSNADAAADLLDVSQSVMFKCTLAPLFK